ncbi:MAG: hypothetical protein HUK08_00390 [Bacteroidaceae bacterium]|nr:hypothetical protein [Bacteroidaceae bacterium]
MWVVHKLIVNAIGIKSFCDDMIRHNVTRFKTVFIDKGGRKYDIDIASTSIMEINDREVTEDSQGIMIYTDNKEKVII